MDQPEEIGALGASTTTPLPSEQKRTRDLALMAAQSAVTSVRIPELSAGEIESDDEPWQVNYYLDETNVYLQIRERTSMGVIVLNLPLLILALPIVIDLQALLADPEAPKIFDLPTEGRIEDIEDIVYEETVSILTRFLYRLPWLFSCSIEQATKESIYEYVKQGIEPHFRDYWTARGMPKSFTLVANRNFQKLCKMFPAAEFPLLTTLDELDCERTQASKRATSDRQTRLTPEIRANLRDYYDDLRGKFRDAKAVYKVQKDGFFASCPGATIEEWTGEWESLSYMMYPDLTLAHRVNDFRNDCSPSELAHGELADRFDTTPNYIRNLLKGSSSRPRKGKSK